MFDIVFEYPLVFLLLFAFVACIFFCKEKKVSIYFPNSKFLQQASQTDKYLITSIKYIIFVSLIIALASPVKIDNIIQKNDKGYEISLILDASGSMKESNKFGIVKEVVSEFIKQRPHDKLALSIFADFAYVAVPLTYDKQSMQRLLQRLDVGVAGMQKTALYEALYLSSNLFKSSKAKEKIAILLTDGIDTAKTIPLNVAINKAKKYGIKVYTVGVGNVGDFDPTILAQISGQTSGKYYSANTAQKLKNIYKEIDQLEKSEVKSHKFVKKTYYFQYPLMISLFFMLLFFFLVHKE